MLGQWILSPQEIMKKDNAWNIRSLIDESFVPLTQRTILNYTLPADLFGVIGHFTFKKAPGEVVGRLP